MYVTTAITATYKSLANFHLFHKLSHSFVLVGCYPTVNFNGFAKPNTLKDTDLAGPCQHLPRHDFNLSFRVDAMDPAVAHGL